MPVTLTLNEQEVGHVLTLLAQTKLRGMPYCIAKDTCHDILEDPRDYWHRHSLITLKLEKADRKAHREG